MAEISEEATQIKETDIVFDCPFCGKSLAIDYRGAGLNVPCTDCGKSVQVPIPEGMDLTDIDSSAEEQEIRIVNLRKALTLAEERIAELENELQALSAERANPADGQQGDSLDPLQAIAARLTEIERLQAELLKRFDTQVEAGA